MFNRARTFSLEALGPRRGVDAFDRCRAWFFRATLFALSLSFVGAFLVAIPMPARAQTCRDLFAPKIPKAIAQMLQLPNDSVLSELEENKIRALLADPSRPGREKWPEVVDIYFEARLRLIPPRLRDSVRQRVAPLKPTFTQRNEIVGSDDQVAFPSAFIDTPLPYITIAHEREHLLRLVVLSGGNRMNESYGLYSLSPVAMYREETHAMGAEWEIARWMSRSDADELIGLSMNFKPRSIDRLFIRSIAAQARTAADRLAYVKAIRTEGRYSFIYSTKKVARNYAKYGAYATAAAAGPAMYWVAYCLLFY